MNFHISKEGGDLRFLGLVIAWGRPLRDFNLPGFLVIGIGNFSLEFGDIDQGTPGIYLTRWIDGEPTTVHVFWKFE